MADRTGLGLIGCRSIWLPARQIQMHWPRSVNATAPPGNKGGLQIAGGDQRHLRMYAPNDTQNLIIGGHSDHRSTDRQTYIPSHRSPSWDCELMAVLPFCIFAFVMKLKTRMNCNLFEIKPCLLGQPVYSFFFLYFFFLKIRDQQQSQTKIAIQDIQEWGWG